MASRSLALTGPLDLRRTGAPLRFGRDDPTVHLGDDLLWRATRTPEGPGALAVRAYGDHVEAQAWGEGGAWLLDRLPALIGLEDVLDGFQPDLHPLVQRLHRRMPGLRIPRTGALFEALVPAICGQRVTTFEAVRSWHQLVRRYGARAPGPTDLMLPPDPAVLAGVPYYDLHVLGIERARADTLRRVAAQAGQLERLVDGDPRDARNRLQRIVGVGPWTAALATLPALGDADAVPVGDLHLPHQVTWALAREPRGDDDRMLELLAPFAGHRGRVVRLILAARLKGPPR